MSEVKLTLYENTLNIMYLSGMFAGGWIWERLIPQVEDRTRETVVEPLSMISRQGDMIIEHFCDELDKQEGMITIVGNSLGGFIALAVAAERPDKIERVIISGAAGFGEASLGFTVNRNKDEMLEKIQGTALYDRAKLDQAHLEQERGRFHKHFTNILRLLSYSNQVSAEPYLEKIECPVYAIWGAKDTLTPICEAMPLLMKYDIQTHIINSTGHSPMYESPDEFASIMNLILDKRFKAVEKRNI